MAGGANLTLEITAGGKLRAAAQAALSRAAREGPSKTCDVFYRDGANTDRSIQRRPRFGAPCSMPGENGRPRVPEERRPSSFYESTRLFRVAPREVCVPVLERFFRRCDSTGNFIAVYSPEARSNPGDKGAPKAFTDGTFRELPNSLTGEIGST